MVAPFLLKEISEKMFADSGTQEPAPPRSGFINALEWIAVGVVAIAVPAIIIAWFMGSIPLLPMLLIGTAAGIPIACYLNTPEKTASPQPQSFPEHHARSGAIREPGPDYIDPMNAQHDLTPAREVTHDHTH